MAKLSEVVSTLKKMAPLSLAESWDNVGLLIEPCSNVQQPIDCVFLTNDLTEDVLDEAESVNANLIVSYHPPVFAPFKRITSDNWKVQKRYIAYTCRVQIVCAHFSFFTSHLHEQIFFV